MPYARASNTYRLVLWHLTGGFALAARWNGIETVQFVEIDPFCQKVLNKNFPGVEIHDDITTFKWTGASSFILTAGTPCQPASCAGKRKGRNDDRWLWQETLRVVAEVKPKWCILENVRGLLTLEQGVEFEQIILEMEAIGYETRTFVIPACAVDAPHRRDRVWIVANASSNGTGERYNRDSLSADNREVSKRRNSKNQENPQSDSDNRYQDVADNDKQCSKKYFRRNKLSKKKRERTFGWPYSPHRIWPAKSDMGLLADGLSAGLAGWCEWPEEPEDVPRVAKGVPERVNRLKALGNAIVPLVAYEIMRIIAVIEKNYEDEVAG